jgi:hypothetical protein
VRRRKLKHGQREEGIIEEMYERQKKENCGSLAW